MNNKQQEQIKIDGIYFTVSWEDRKLLQDTEASLYGCCTTEGVKEFQKLISEIRDRSTERNFEFDVYLTDYTELNTEIKSKLDDLLPKLEKGDIIKLYGKITTVEGFAVYWNEGFNNYEIILLTTGRGDPFKRTLDHIDIHPNI